MRSRSAPSRRVIYECGGGGEGGLRSVTSRRMGHEWGEGALKEYTFKKCQSVYLCTGSLPPPPPPFPLSIDSTPCGPPLPPSTGGQGISTFAKALGSAELQSLDITSCKLVGKGEES